MASDSPKIVTALRPDPNVVQNDPRAELSEPEQAMYTEVLAHFTKLVYTLPGIEKGELMDVEKFWLSRECILRFLRATKWKVADAIQRLEATLKWRREFGIYDVVTADLVEPEAVTGKEVVFGYDVTGRPALYMIPSRQNTTEPKPQVQYAFWMLERAIDLMEPGVETIALLINFADRGKNPSISTALTVLHILQDHYPERLGLSLIINVPFLVNAFFKIVMPLVDPVTRAKVKFNPQIIKDGLFSKEQVMKEWWGGDKEFEYKHEEYWKDLVSLCETRSKAWEENWRALGAKIGESEWAYKKLSSASDTLIEKANVDVTVSQALPTEPTPTSNAAEENIVSSEKKENHVAPSSTETEATAIASTTGIGASTAMVAEAGDAGAAAGSDAGAE